jgi:hypothetical protein
MAQKSINVAGGDGTAVPSGFVNQYFNVAATAVTASGVDSLATICSQLLTPGDYRITAFDSFFMGARPSAGIMAGGADIFDGTSVLSDGRSAAVWFSTADARDSQYFQVCLAARISINANKTISFRVRNDQISGSPGGTPTCDSRGFGKLIIERVG